MFDNSDAECCNGIKYDYYNDRFYNEKKTEEERRQKREERQRMYRPQPIHATSMTSFIMREKDSQNLDIEKIFSSGAVVVQRFDVEGPTYTTLANRTLYLIEKKDITAEKTVQNPKVYNNLEFEWVQDELRWDEQKSVEELKKRVGGFANGYKLDEDQQAIVELLKKKIKDHVMEMERYIEPVKQRDEAVRRLHENSLQKLIPLVANLDYDNLNTLKQFYLTQRTDDNLIIAQRNIFIEILPVAGTAPAALIIRDIVLNNELNSDLENARILASLPFHIRPIKRSQLVLARSWQPTVLPLLNTMHSQVFARPLARYPHQPTNNNEINKHKIHSR